MKKLVIIFALLVLVACNQSSESEKQITENRSIQTDQVVLTTIPNHEKEPFSTSISVSKQIKLKEEFVIEATLKNQSDNDLTILHASGVFYFTIKDSNGKRVNTFAMDDVGIIRTLQAKGEITEQYIYKLEEPGYYELSATARLNIGEDHFEVETNKINIEVIPLNYYERTELLS
jgi:hypothetical protein